MKIEVEYPGLCAEKTPAGSPRWRVRVDGDPKRKISIPVGPGHDDFPDYYEAARRGVKYERKAPEKPRRGTLDELCERYCAAMAVLVASGDMSELTRSGRERGLKQACDTTRKGIRIGSMKADLPEEAFVYILDSFGTRTGAAETCLKAMKAAYRWGRSRGFPQNSCVFSVASPHKSKGGATPWTAEDESKFLARHGPGTMARRWFFLAKNMAGRIGDTHDIGPANIKLKEGRAFLAWQPKKKGSKFVEVPVMPELAEELNAGPVHEDGFIMTEYGRPFASPGSLDNRVRKWVVEAGLCKVVEVREGNTVKREMKATRSQHGIRKRVAEELALAGGTTYEIMARLSHSDPKTAAVYTADVDRASLTKSGFARLENAASQTRGVPRSEKRGTPEGTGSSITRRSVQKWQPVGESNPSFQVENLAS